MAPNIYCCGAGTAADTEAVTGTFCVLWQRLELCLIVHCFPIETGAHTYLFVLHFYCCDGYLLRYGKLPIAHYEAQTQEIGRRNNHSLITLYMMEREFRIC